MNSWKRWQRWSSEAITRVRALLVLIALVSIGAVTNRYVPRLPSQTTMHTAPAPFRPLGGDSVFTVVRPKPLRTAPSRPTLKRYRRSAQVDAAITELRSRGLALPLPQITSANLNDSFENVRGGGIRRHYAIDIAAPTGTPILAVDDGTVLELRRGGNGGIALFASDSRGQFIFYYAHLLKYHPRIERGLTLMRGDTIGYVGTSGNARNNPHLHFAISLSSGLTRWSSGTPINPAEVWRD